MLLSYYTYEYNKFMIWFRTNYPDICKKYTDNIGKPLKPGGQVVINSMPSLNQDALKMLSEIIKEYYEEPA